MSSLIVPTTFELRLRTIRNKRRASRLASLVKLGAWLTSLTAGLIVAGGALVVIR